MIIMVAAPILLAVSLAAAGVGYRALRYPTPGILRALGAVIAVLAWSVANLVVQRSLRSTTSFPIDTSTPLRRQDYLEFLVNLTVMLAAILLGIFLSRWFMRHAAYHTVHAPDPGDHAV
jgi:hypothetical protein